MVSSVKSPVASGELPYKQSQSDGGGCCTNKPNWPVGEMPRHSEVSIRCRLNKQSQLTAGGPDRSVKRSQFARLGAVQMGGAMDARQTKPIRPRGLLYKQTQLADEQDTLLLQYAIVSTLQCRTCCTNKANPRPGDPIDRTNKANSTGKSIRWASRGLGPGLPRQTKPISEGVSSWKWQEDRGQVLPVFPLREETPCGVTTNTPVPCQTKPICPERIREDGLSGRG
jgi:hypothetical protein